MDTSPNNPRAHARAADTNPPRAANNQRAYAWVGETNPPRAANRPRARVLVRYEGIPTILY